MIMEVENIERVDGWNERFIELGYIVKGENGISRRRYFIHGTEENVRIIYTCLKKEIQR